MQIFNPKSILVTGGAGFIGANFVRYLLSVSDAKVVNLDKLTYAADLNFLGKRDEPNYQFVEGSITDAQLIEKLFIEHQFDCVVHFAAESHVDRSISGPMEFINTNIQGTAVLLEAARQLWQQQNRQQVRFHHISTDEVFGSLSLDAPAFCETTPYDPSSPYSASKAASDHLVMAWHRTYGLPVTLSNCSNNYGPGQHDEKLIPTVIRKAIMGEQIPVYGDGSNRRDWLYVIDHCEAIWQVISKGCDGETYAIGGGVELSNLEVIRQICNVLNELHPAKADYYQQVGFIEDRAGHDWRYAINANKIAAQLDWTARYQFDEAIRETASYYIKKYLGNTA